MINSKKTKLIARHDIAPCALHISGILLLLSCLMSPVEAWAATVTAFSNNQGSFSIHANNLNRMIEAEIRINYQSEDPTPPQVTATFLDRRSTTLTTTVSAPGSLVFQLKIDKKMPKSGYVPLAIARIPGSITSLTARLLNENGMTEFPQVSITNPTPEQLADMAAAQRAKADQIDKAGKPDKTDTAVADKSDTKSPTPPDAAYPSGAQPDRTATPLAADSPVTFRANPPPTAAVSADKIIGSSPVEDEMPRSLSFYRRESLLDRFSVLPGVRTPAALARLLRRNDDDFIQEPPLLLSDGTAAIRLTVRSLGRGAQGPQFFISGAHCSNLKIGENEAWVLEIIPERGTLNASVTVLAGSQAIEYPLAVAPPLDFFDATVKDPDLTEFVKAANGLVRSGGVATVLKKN